MCRYCALLFIGQICIPHWTLCSPLGDTLQLALGILRSALGSLLSALGTQQSAFGHSAIRIGHSAVRIAHYAIRIGHIAIRIRHSAILTGHSAIVRGKPFFRKASEVLEDMFAKLRGPANYFRRKAALCSPRFVPSLLSMASLRSPMCV